MQRMSNLGRTQTYDSEFVETANEDGAGLDVEGIVVGFEPDAGQPYIPEATFTVEPLLLPGTRVADVHALVGFDFTADVQIEATVLLLAEVLFFKLWVYFSRCR